ncbi:hypothetical protein [Chryseobacterium sp. SIMBA_028]|uniref:hypothetical protein n=1 Tax=Chryseobacterium sp. SIMBA_028 TaxID=3085771 RepID=UPI00397C4773
MIYFKINVLLFLTIFFNPILAQHTEDIVDGNPIYSVEGTGYIDSETKKRMVFSNLTVEGNNQDEISLNDNEIKVKKEGIYRITLGSEVNKTLESGKYINYFINLNGKPAFQSELGMLSSQGIYSFQIQLKKDDLLSFDITDHEALNPTFKNTMSIRFTDPKLIMVSDHHH